MSDYRTTDLAAAAFCVARGHRLVKLDGQRGTPRTFVFEPDAAADAGAFYSGAAIPAAVYADALRSLKGLLRRAT